MGYHSPCMRSSFCESSSKCLHPEAYHFLPLNMYIGSYTTALFRSIRNGQYPLEITFEYRKVNDTGCIPSIRQLPSKSGDERDRDLCVLQTAWCEAKLCIVGLWPLGGQDHRNPPAFPSNANIIAQDRAYGIALRTATILSPTLLANVYMEGNP